MISKKQIADALALSCVEYYFLPWLSQFYPVEKLYIQSFVPLKQLFEDFSNGDRYERYNRIPRVQDTAEQHDITTHTFLNATMSHAADIIAEQGKNDLCLIRVNEKFFQNNKRMPWREDHYICLEKELNWVNEYPLSDGILTNEEFLQIYDGAICLFCLKDLCNVPENKVAELLRCQDFAHIEYEIGLDKFENALGILRVSRKRMEKLFSEQTAVCDLLRAEIALLDKMYFSARLQRIRRNGDEKELYRILERVITIERSIAEVVK